MMQLVRFRIAVFVSFTCMYNAIAKMVITYDKSFICLEYLIPLLI